MPDSLRRKKRHSYTPGFIKEISWQLNLEVLLNTAMFACLTTCFYALARLSEFVVHTLTSFNPNIHVTTQNLTYKQDHHGYKVTVLHLPSTKSTGTKGEDVYWASQQGDTDPEVALQNYLCHEPRYWSTTDQYKATLLQGKQAQDTSLWFPYRFRAG